MSEFKVVLPTTTEEWQRDMNIAYEKGRADAIEYVLSGQYAKDNKKCTMCYDCPKNCPIELKE